MGEAADSLRRRVAQAGLDWIVPAWDAPANALTLVTTRNGREGAAFDVGPAHLDALDGASRARVLEDRAFAHGWLPSPPVYLEQVHGARVVEVEAPSGGDDAWPVADAAVTRTPGVVLAVRVADCLPVVLCDERGRVVAAAHAGWRGLAAGVLEATVEAMDAPARAVRAWIGPGIGPRAFEVGADVLHALVASDPLARSHFTPHARDKWLADLPALAERRLRSLGVGHVVRSGLCTHGDASRFHSYRRDGSRGRMAAYAWLDPS